MSSSLIPDKMAVKYTCSWSRLFLLTSIVTWIWPGHTVKIFVVWMPYTNIGNCLPRKINRHKQNYYPAPIWLLVNSDIHTRMCVYHRTYSRVCSYWNLNEHSFSYAVISWRYRWACFNHSRDCTNRILPQQVLCIEPVRYLYFDHCRSCKPCKRLFRWLYWNHQLDMRHYIIIQLQIVFCKQFAFYTSTLFIKQGVGG